MTDDWGLPDEETIRVCAERAADWKARQHENRATRKYPGLRWVGRRSLPPHAVRYVSLKWPIVKGVVFYPKRNRRMRGK